MKYVEEYLQTLHNANSRKIYRRDLEQLYFHFEKDLELLCEEELKEYFEACTTKFESKSIQRKASVIRKFYHFLLSERKMANNPFPILETKALVRSKRERLSLEEYEALKESLLGEDQLIVQTLWETEAKILDLYDVKRQSLIDYHFQALVGMRQGKVYYYALEKELSEKYRAWAEHLGEEEYFFQGNRQQFAKAIKKHCPDYQTSQIKKESWMLQKVDLDKVREHYFAIGIGDEI